MAESSRRNMTSQNGGYQVRTNQPLVYNHHQMLRNIRDNLKHLKREPENQSLISDGKENESKSVSYTNTSTANGMPTSHNQRVNLSLFSGERNTFGDSRRNLEPLQGQQASRTYDESGYSSSSSECSSLSANDLSASQPFVGNMPFYGEEAVHQGLFSPSSFDFVPAMAHNDSYQRVNPGVSQRRDVPTSMAPHMQYRAKSPPPYRVAAQKTNYNGSSDHLPMPTNLTSTIETSRYMQKTSLPSGGTTSSQAEWKVITGTEHPTRGRSPVPLGRQAVPKGGALWKSRPYSVGQNPLPTPPSTSQATFPMGPYGQKPQHVAPQFQVQVSLNTPNGSPANITPVISKGSAHSATFRVSVQTSPMSMTPEHDAPDARFLGGMQQGMSAMPRHEPVADFRDSAAVSSVYDHQAPVIPAGNGFMPTFGSTKHQFAQNPPPYMRLAYKRPPPPSDSSQSSFTSYQSSESDVRSYTSLSSRDHANDHVMDAELLHQWSHRSAPSVDNMSVSSSSSESHSSTVEEEEFPEFDHASLASQEEYGEDGTPTVYTNKTGTLVVHVNNRPALDTTEKERDASDEKATTNGGDASAENGKSDRLRSQRLTTPQAFKFFMEQRVENLHKAREEREQRRVQLEEEMRRVQLSEQAQSEMRKILNQKESNYIRLKRTKMNASMFRKLQVIGVGAFGEVCLTKHVQSGSLYAMKILKKAEVLRRNQVAHVKAERDILAEADNEWVVKLFYSFQDSDNLYFVMEYVPGGDLMSLLIKFGVFSEDLARFYIAELVLAIESVHKMGFIHRDIKPDNVLIDSDGHIKLTDFGLCTGLRWTHDSKYYQSGTLPRNHSRAPSGELDTGIWAKEHKCRCGHAVDGKKPLGRRHIRQHKRCQAHSLVGTPNYIAPEVLMRIPYTHLCDWWSVGVILYEMLVGQPPFYAPNAAETQMKVINWESTLQIPRQAKLSSEAEDLILRLCNSPNQRLGINGPDEIKNHPFFHGIDWLMIRRTKAHYVPHIRHPEDTSNFDPIEPERAQSDDCQSMAEVGEEVTRRKHPSHAFYEFTFRRFFTRDPARSSMSNYSSWDETESDENKAPVFV